MKKYTPLDGLRWSRNSDSALNNMPQTDVLGRAGGGMLWFWGIILHGALAFLPVVREIFCIYQRIIGSLIFYY